MPSPSRLVVVVVAGLVLGIAAFACAGQALPSTAPKPAIIPTAATTATTSATAAIAAPSTTQAARASSPTTPTTTTTAPPRGWLVIHGTGDVNLDPSYIPALANNGYDWAWSGLEGLFLDDGLTVVNLECAPSSLGVAEDKAFTFRCPDGLAEMAEAGVDVANLGNNHSQDFGKEALLDGIRNLRRLGVAPVGAGRTAFLAGLPAIVDASGWRVAVVGFGGVRPHDGWVATDDQPGMADGDTFESMVSTIEAASAIADFVIVTIHWGVELDNNPRDEDVARAGAFLDAGADAIFGHHPHRLQPFETVKDRPVFWSLGNFVWPEMSPDSARTGVARVVISPEGRVIGCLIPALIESSGHPVLVGDPPCGAP